MQSILIGKSLLALSLCWIAVDSAAQTTFGRFDQSIECKRLNSSRIESDLHCNELRPAETVVIEHEMEITTRVAGLAIQMRQCKAEVALKYLQKNMNARVDATLENSTCAASSGSIVFSVRTLNASGDQTVQEFTEQWAREDDQPVNVSAEYLIGEDVDLVRVRASKVQCLCAE